MLDHFTASGSASPAALEKAGLPGGIMTGGSAALSVDYADRRDGSGAVAIDLDLRDAAIMTPLGWSKAAGPGARASARLGLTHGSITSIDRLQASGPDLVVAQPRPASRGTGHGAATGSGDAGAHAGAGLDRAARMAAPRRRFASRCAGRRWIFPRF